MRTSDLVSGLVIAIASVLVLLFVIPNGIDVVTGYGLDPRVFPVATIVVALLLALALVVSRLRQPSDAAEAPPLTLKSLAFVCAVGIFLVVGYLAMERFGFLFVAPVMVAVAMAVMGELRHPVRMVLVCVVSTMVVYYSFQEFFYIILP